LKISRVCEFHFTNKGDTEHFYYLYTDAETKEIRHFVKTTNSLYWVPQVSQKVPKATTTFRVVDESVSIIDGDGRDGRKSSVRLKPWLGEGSQEWTDFSGPTTWVNHYIGLTVHTLGTVTPSVLFTYVDLSSGEWVFLVVKQGQSLGFEHPIPLAYHWFKGYKGLDADATFAADALGYPLVAPDFLPHTTPVVGTQIIAPITNPDVLSKPPKIQAVAPATEVKDDIPDVLEWIRKFCSDRFIPRTDGTINTISRKGLHHDHATVATSSQLWDLGDDPLLYKFMDGKYGGHENQRKKVRETIPEWSQYANVTFKEAGKDEPAPIRITFDPSDGSWAIVGNHSCKEDEGRATMNLGWVNGFNSTLHREERAVILHEFGHALGMFHEHQSPAHGNQTVVDPKAAIEFYKKTQGWSEEEVMEQVVRPYNENDVSNFSQVDTKSIMHYFQPSEVTSGPSIEYNYVLSDLDKAYMVINYPRSLADERKRVNDKDWTLDASLKKAGLTENDPTLAANILAVRDSPGQDGIDVGQIRDLFTKWARAQHTIKDKRLRSATRQYMKGVIDRHHGLEPQGDTTLYTAQPDPCPCEYTGTGSQDPLTEDSERQKARAVVLLNHKIKVQKFFRKDLNFAMINFTWTMVRDPTETGGMTNRDPGLWERDQIKKAMDQWAKFCSVIFTWVEPQDTATADLIIVFQDINPINGKRYHALNSANSSYYYPGRWNDDKIKISQTVLGTRRLDEWDDTHHGYETAIKPPVVHDICYRGIATKETAEDSAPLANTWPLITQSQRTIVHELGHFFGLDHENLGFWGMLWEDREGRESLLAAAEVVNVKAITFDNASVMDAQRK
jgi:hypothetical protein